MIYRRSSYSAEMYVKTCACIFVSMWSLKHCFAVKVSWLKSSPGSNNSPAPHVGSRKCCLARQQKVIRDIQTSRISPWSILTCNDSLKGEPVNEHWKVVVKYLRLPWRQEVNNTHKMYGLTLPIARVAAERKKHMSYPLANSSRSKQRTWVSIKVPLELCWRTKMAFSAAVP